MIIKDPFADYNKNKNFENLEELYRVQVFIRNYILNGCFLTSLNTNLLEIIKASKEELGYYLNPESTFKYLEELSTLSTLLPNNAIINMAKEVSTVKNFVTRNTKMLPLHEDTLNVKGTYNVLVSFKYAPIEILALKNCINHIREDCKEEKCHIKFYMVDNFFKDTSTFMDKDFEKLEILVKLLHESKPLLNRIKQKNLSFNKVKFKYDAVYKNITEFMQKTSLPNDSMIESTQQFVKPELFRAFLRKYTKGKAIKYNVINATKSIRSRLKENKDPKMKLLYLNINALFLKDFTHKKNINIIHDSTPDMWSMILPDEEFLVSGESLKTDVIAVSKDETILNSTLQKDDIEEDNEE